MIINRVWAMPNKNTFEIPPIREFILKNIADKLEIYDPFCGDSTIANHRNDLKISKIDSLYWMRCVVKSESADAVLFDPPYSPRQLKECYNSVGQPLHDTKSSVWKDWKDQIARITKYNGCVLSFGWQSGGIGKDRGFELVEILLVAHGGNHNDTICTKEIKI